MKHLNNYMEMEINFQDLSVYYKNLIIIDLLNKLECQKYKITLNIDGMNIKILYLLSLNMKLSVFKCQLKPKIK